MQFVPNGHVLQLLVEDYDLDSMSRVIYIKTRKSLGEGVSNYRGPNQNSMPCQAIGLYIESL